MSDSARDALIVADAAIARVRARLGESVEHDGETAAASRTADDWERYALAIVLEAKLVESAKNFRMRWPALVKWRERVLQNRRRAKPADVAAALESLALECTLADEFELAARTQQQAIDVMRSKVIQLRRRAHTPNVPNVSAVTDAAEQSA